ncbi:MAG: antirestriction protein [Gammaproteobacteria bacterium]|nr:antirestriction protein [Gammaproteobacteria bacterium]
MAMPALKTSIVATLVKPEDRMRFLPNYFGQKHMLAGERLVFAWMERLCSAYRGGYWDFYTLSNGGCYMAPKREGDMHIEWPDNFTDVMMSPDTAGIVATIFALGHLCEITEQDRHAKLFNLLRDYACEHPDATKILRAID